MNRATDRLTSRKPRGRALHQRQCSCYLSNPAPVTAHSNRQAAQTPPLTRMRSRLATDLLPHRGIQVVFGSEDSSTHPHVEQLADVAPLQGEEGQEE